MLIKKLCTEMELSSYLISYNKVVWCKVTKHSEHICSAIPVTVSH